MNKSLSALLEADIQNFSKNNAVEETFLYECLTYLGEDTHEEGRRFEALTFLHPAVIEKFEKFPPEIQDAIRSGILNVAIGRYRNIKALGSLGLFIREIIELDNKVKDGFKEWIDPLGELIKWMASEEAGTA